MGRDRETILKEALKCFIRRPRLEDEALLAVRAEIENLAEIYQENLRSQVCQPTFTSSWRFRFEGQSDTLQERGIPVTRRRGRPKNIAANMLVFDCRNLLIQNGCIHSASGNRSYQSNLQRLVEHVHELSGLPPRRGWRDRAEAAGGWRWQFQLTYGLETLPISTPLDLKRMWDCIAMTNFGTDPERMNFPDQGPNIPD